MKKSTTWLTILGLAVAASVVVIPWAARGEGEISIDGVPEAARAALLELAGDAKIIEVERETEHGVVVYEAEWVVDGREHEAAVTADGTLVEMEQEVSLEDVPAAVRAAIVKHFPGDPQLEIEKTTIVAYEVEARIDGKERELVIYPTGKVRRAHAEHAKKAKPQGDDDEDDDD